MWCVMVYTSFWFICCQCCGCSCHTVDREHFAVFIFSRVRHVFSLSFFFRCAFFAFIRLLVVEYIINDDYLFYYYMIDYFIRSHILLYVVLNKETINSTFFSWLLSPFREQFFFVFCFSLCSVFLLLIFFSFSASKLEMVAVVCAELLFR